MDRRRVLKALAASVPWSWKCVGLGGLAALGAPHDALAADENAAACRRRLHQSGPVASRFDGQTIEYLDIRSDFRPGLTILHQRVTVRNCRIAHSGSHGLVAVGAAGLILQDCEIDHVGAPPSGSTLTADCVNIALEHSPNARLTRIKASRGAANIYALLCPGLRMNSLELHDARGPLPRGQNIQLDKSPGALLEDFSAENGPTSWTEDNISIYRSDNCTVRRGLVLYNNSPTGDGVMIEGSFNCRVEDVDAVEQGNGAFAAVPEQTHGSGGCSFVRCRTRDSYNTPRDGRAKPSSNGLSFYTKISPGARPHQIIDCHFDALANPHNLIWKLRAVAPGWSFSRQSFSPRPAVRLRFCW